MAGGAEPDEDEYCEFDDDNSQNLVPSDSFKPHLIKDWINSSATLNADVS